MRKDEEHRRFHPEGHHEFGCPGCEARAADELAANQIREAEAMRQNVGVEAPSVEQLVGALPEDPDDLAALIRHCNAALPGSDPRKITREMVNSLRDAPSPAVASEIADALESYLPPET